MPEELKKTSKDIMNEILSDVYTDAFKAKEEGRPVCWATGIAPQELLETMGIDVVYPENHSASMGAKKTSMQAIERAEQAGYSSDICSYARCNFGYIMNNYHTEGTNMPAPDFVLCCTNTCYLVAKWYENLAKELNIPILYLDTPYNYDAGGVQPHMISYMTEQVKHIMKQLEEIV